MNRGSTRSGAIRIALVSAASAAAAAFAVTGAGCSSGYGDEEDSVYCVDRGNRRPGGRPGEGGVLCRLLAAFLPLVALTVTAVVGTFA